MSAERSERPVVVTGASGYLGRHVVRHLVRGGLRVLALPRQAAGRAEGSGHAIALLELLEPRLADASAGPSIPVLIHLAGIAGRARLPSPEGEAALEFARRIATLARTAGVERIILASSIYATDQEQGRPSPYGAHKLAIEALFREHFEGELIVLRLPPVYGGEETHSGVSKLWRLVGKGIPLPFGRAHALRDYLAIENLAGLVESLVQDADRFRPGETVVYEPSDGHPISTRELVAAMARLQGVRRVLLPIPAFLMKAIDVLTGRKGGLSAAFTPLRTAGNERIRRETGWSPALRIPDSLSYLRGRP